MNLPLFLALRCAAIVAGFLLTFYVARALSDQPAAEVLYFLSLILAGSSLARLGSDIQIVRQISHLMAQQRQRHAHGVSRQAIVMTAMSSIAVAVMAALLGKPAGLIPQWVNPVWLLPGVIAVSVLYSATEAMKGMMALNLSITLQGLVPPILVLLLLLTVGRAEPGYQLVTIGYAVAALAGLVYVVRLTRGGSWRIAPRDKDYLRGALAYSPKAAVAFLYPHLPVLVVAAAAAATSGVEAVAVIIRIGMVVGVPIVAINAFYAPRIARLHADERDSELRQLYRRVVALSVAGGLVLALLLVFARVPVLAYFGLDPATYALPYLVVLFAQAINAATGPNGIFAAMMKMDSLVNAAAFMLLSLFLATLVAGGPIDAESVLIAYAVAWSLENLFLFAAVTRRLGFWGRKDRYR